MKIRLGGVEFEVKPVAERVRDAILTDPVIAQVVEREVFRWDHATAKGEALVPMAKGNVIPLPNAVAIFVPKAGANGVVAKADGPSKKMAERVLEAIGAKKIEDLSRALHSLVQEARTKLPMDRLAKLGQAASYTLSLRTEFAVVELRNAARNLVLHAVMPGQVTFLPKVTARDDAAWEALEPADRAPDIVFVVPPRTKAGLNLRVMALARRLEEMRGTLEMQGDDADAALKRAYSINVGEWRLLTRKNPAAA